MPGIVKGRGPAAVRFLCLRRCGGLPSTKTWMLKAAERVRGHVEGEIRAAGADLAVETERRGRPYSPICRKNRASYERRAAQRRQDLADIAALRERRERAAPQNLIITTIIYALAWRPRQDLNLRPSD